MSINVSTLVKYLKNKLDSDDKLQNVKVNGELSNFHKHSSGHLYFTLKDEKAAISCVMFSSRANLISFNPKNGDKVEISANASIFEITGQLQLYVNSMKLSGVGDLYQQYEELKKKLLSEGYFDDRHKKVLKNRYPEKVGVLVGDKSAAMSDIKTCFARRWPLAQVDYYPVLVQGKDAPADIIKTLKQVDVLSYDYLILARGGGSFEDLFCFNNEDLVKTIYNLNTFIVTGIGHEQDYTLADFVADLRAPTPTASVELTTNNIDDVNSEIDDNCKLMYQSLIKRVNTQYITLDYYITKINSFSSKGNLLANSIDKLISDMNILILHKIDRYTNLIDSYSNLIKAYSIDNTLKRGFSLVYKDNKLIKNKSSLHTKDELNIRLYGGEIKAAVKEV